MSRKPIIAANWKMNIGPAEGAQFIESFILLVHSHEFIICTFPFQIFAMGIINLFSSIY